MVAVKFEMVNAKICEEKTWSLMREIQDFEFSLSADVKAALFDFKGLSRPFTERYAELASALFKDSSFPLPMPPRSSSYVTSKQANVIWSSVKKALLAFKNEAINTENAAIERHQNRLVAAVALIHKDHFIREYSL